jgi:hypothetical protein
MLGSRKNNYLYYMKRSDLKELIKKSMLEVSPKSGAMTPEEEKMVADYEEEEANKYALDKEEPMEEDILREADEIVAAYTKKKTLKEAAPSSANASKIAKLQKERDQLMHDMEQEAEPEGGPVADEYGVMLDKIDAQIRKLKGLKETASIKEEMHGGYLELMEMNPKFDQGIEMLLEVWEEWKSGEMTEPEMIDEAKQDILAYLSSMMN